MLGAEADDRIDRAVSRQHALPCLEPCALNPDETFSEGFAFYPARPTSPFTFPIGSVQSGPQRMRPSARSGKLCGSREPQQPRSVPHLDVPALDGADRRVRRRVEAGCWVRVIGIRRDRAHLIGWRVAALPVVPHLDAV